MDKKEKKEFLLIGLALASLLYPSYVIMQSTFDSSIGSAAALYGLGAEKQTPKIEREVVIVEKEVYDHRPGVLLVKFIPGVSENEKDKYIKAMGATKIREIKGIETALLKVPLEAQESLLQALQKNPRVEFAELDYHVEPSLIPNDPSYGSQWHHQNIRSEAAWNNAIQGGSVTIGIVDTGVNASHVDLGESIVPGFNTVDGSQTSDSNGHGTKVAGTAAAVGNNGVGVAGVSYSSKVMPIKVSNTSDGYAYWSDIAEAVVYAADHGARVANVSYAACNSASVQNAGNYMKSKGGLVTVASGNSGSLLAYADSKDLICVSATASNDVRTSWSSYGEYVDLTMPGSGILTTTNGGGYGSVSGTSFSAPLAAGAIALLMETNPSLTPNQIEGILESTARDLGDTGFDIYYGWGIIDLGAAVLAAISVSGPTPDTTNPTATITFPLNNSDVTGVVNILVSGADNEEVSKIELYKNETLFATDSTAPYNFAWNTMAETNGTYPFVAIAYDAANNTGTSNSISLQVANIVDTENPNISITSPQNGNVLPSRGSFTISASATDNVGVQQIVLKLDSTVYGICDDAATCSASVNLKKVSAGEHLITAEVLDGAGNTASSSIDVTVGGSTSGGGGGGGGKGRKK